MDDLRLRELLRPLANAVAPPKLLNAQRKVIEGFRDDGTLESRVLDGALPQQRLDWIVPPGATAGVQSARFHIPADAHFHNIAMIATGNVSATFPTDILVNGVRAASSAIRVGTSQAKGALNVTVPAGSIVSLETKANISQGVTVSVFLQAGSSSSSSGGGSGGSSGGGGGTGDILSVNGQTGVVLLDADNIDETASRKYVSSAEKTKLSNLSGTNTGDQNLAPYALTSSLAGVALSGAYADLSGKPVIPTTLAALDTTVTGAQLNALKTKVDGVAAGATANSTDAQLRDRATHTGAQAISTVTGLQTALNGKASTSHNHDSAYAAIGHNHDGTYVKPADLAAYSPATHNHDTVYAAISHSHAWGDITGKPTTFAPEAHQHNVSDLTATGTRSSTTILYGDNTWKTAPSGGGGVTDHTLLTSIGTNTHAQIDTHIASTSNPHSVTKAQVGLSNVPNTDFTAAVAANTAKISFDSTASTKLAGIAAGAEVNVNADWNAESGDAHILNKPLIPKIYSRRWGNSPNSTPTTVVTNLYADCDVMWTLGISTTFPEITSGTWEIDVTAWATMYRSVSTGGIRLYLGDGSTDSAGALGRNFDQTNGYTLNVAATFNGMTSASVIDLRYGGFSTAGSTYCVSHGGLVTARRSG